MVSESDISEAKKKKESTAQKDDKAEKAGKKVAKDIEYDEGHKGKDDDKAEKAGKKVTKDIEYDDKKDSKKKKSLKDWFEAIDKNMLNENDLALPILGKDGKAVSVQPGFIKMQGDTSPAGKAMSAAIKDMVAKKQIQVVAPIDKPQTQPNQQQGQQGQQAQQNQQQSGMAATAMKEEILDEKAPPGMEDVVLSLKKKFPGQEGRAYAIAWDMYNKKHGKNEGAEDNPPAPADTGEMLEAGINANPFEPGYHIAYPKDINDLETAFREVDQVMDRAASDDEVVGAIRSFSPKIQQQMKDWAMGKTKHNFSGNPEDNLTGKEAIEQDVHPESQWAEAVIRAFKNQVAEGKLKEKWAGDAKVNPTGQYKDKTVEELKSMLAKLKKSGPHDKDSPAAKKMRQINFALRAKGGWKKGEGAAMKEAEIPHSGPDYGAGLGAGRNDKVLEAKPDFLDLDKDGNKKESMKKAAADKKKQKVKESMNTLEAAYHEGKSHGLSKHGYACRYNEGSEEHKRYHDGFKEGLDECYGLMPNRGLVVSEVESEADVVDNMASYGAEEGALSEMDKTAYMQHKAKTTPGDSFKAFGQTFKDKEVLEMDAFTFEALDKQLNDLLNENTVNEGLSVNMSQGLNDGMGDDSVSVSATGDDASKLLDFIKQVGLGGLGGAEASAEEPAVVAQISDYGAPKFGGYEGHDGMKDLMSRMSGGDYEQEGGEDHSHEETCNECGMAEAKCGCDEGKEMVDEVETEDQLEYEVAEDSAGADEVAMTTADEDAEAAEDKTKPAFGGATNEDTGSEASSGPASGVEAADDEEEAQAEMNESSMFKKLLSLLAEESTEKEDEKAEKAGKKVTKDIEYDDKKDKEEKLDEWANDAGKKGTDASFERDIEFMTKVIAGGLNKPKATGQTTIPVIASQDARNGDEDVSAWKKLAGLEK